MRKKHSSKHESLNKKELGLDTVIHVKQFQSGFNLYCYLEKVGENKNIIE